MKVRRFTSYKCWKTAVSRLPNFFWIDGDKDIACALFVSIPPGEYICADWDGVDGIIETGWKGEYEL